jgi:TPR repeat protein
MRRAACLVFVLLAFACKRGKSPPQEQAVPQPSASVFSLAVAPGTCPDIEACERECDAGSSDRCMRLGTTLESGKGSAKDEKRAAALFEQACAMGNNFGCLNAGRVHEFGHGVPKDDAKAAEFNKKACELGNAAGCYNEALFFAEGRGVAKDDRRALELFEGACDAGAKQACIDAKAVRDRVTGGGGK